MIDQRGASPLHWAAGSGYLDVTRYLIEECECDPNKGQKGKRSFSGRTSLHWAARNGHVEIVRYLVRTCSVDLEAATIDGTTGFCWAAWQGHLKIMEYVNARLGGRMEFCLCLTH
jgi:ankyrin repeat protein